MTDTTTQHEAPPTPEYRTIDDLIADSLRTLSEAHDNVRALAAALGAPDTAPLPQGGPGPLPACRIQRGQQLVRDGHWWHVTNVERCDLDTVALTLIRPGLDGNPVRLVFDADLIFTVAEPF